MNPRIVRSAAGVALALAAGGVGYMAGGANASSPHIPEQNVSAPAPGTVRIIYSLDEKQNDQQIIALINAAKTKIYFAMHEFTLQDIADALVAAKKRGVDVRGLVDSVESQSSYDKPIISELVAAGIPIETEKHPDGNGIMHIKAIVTDSAYALGSYNWTGSATTENDELLEIGTDPSVRQAYENVLTQLLAAYAGNGVAGPTSAGTIDYTQASQHIGQYASVQGTLLDSHTSSSGTVFLDFCQSYKTCPFSAVIFADDVSKFGDLSRYNDESVTVSGTISSYQGNAEIVLSDPSQISN
jgi:hypothetical protein